MKFKKVVYTFLSLTFIFSLLLASSCSNQEVSKNGEEKTIVAVTVLPQKAFVEAVCGDLAEVVTIVPPGNSPGNYEPTPQEMENFNKAAVYFTIGVPTEKANILPKAENMEIVDLPANVDGVYSDREFSPGKRDPHIWLSVKRAKVMINIIAETMSSLKPENAQIYQENAEAFMKELDSADAEIKNIFSTINNKRFIVFHPAYGYFADEYGLEMYALQEDGKESTPQQLQEMIDLARGENIKVIFTQPEFDSEQSDAFAEEIGGENIMLDPLSDDYIVNLKSMANSIAAAMQ
ncbi:MAG: metal ABC transporter solute-binding protein, Zn/Mn family [Eubacteriales bacterium]